MSFWQNKKVVVTGGYGFLGSHVCDLLRAQGVTPITPQSKNYDLRYESGKFLDDVGDVDILFNLAANVGGIGYNQNHPYNLFYDNITLGTSLIHEAILHRVKKFVQVGTVCAYPKFAPVPFLEECLWDGYPEETNAPYGLAKKMLLVQLQSARKEYGFNSIYILPTNLYGPRDNFAPERSHVIPALIRKFCAAVDSKEDSVMVWGSGQASRDFLYVEDAARGLILAAEKYERDEPLNLGSGNEIKINVLAYLIATACGFDGNITYDTSKPDGQPRRGLNSQRAKHALGWCPRIELKDGLKRTVEWFRKNAKN